ncbi:MAG TPA: WhiB family transcriptional regulator [Pseudonocardiaceae bacterium]|nr:WhiB family transcriptional regulator [Pseudonocardiaceae bacterium]
MVKDTDSPDYEAMATGLDRWQPVPTEVLRDVVMRRGLCLWGLWPEVEPDWDECAPSDRTLATRLCAGCPVTGQCLELDLRIAGACTTGVWGALCEDDRRALHPLWQRRRHQHDRLPQEGEPES